MMKPPEQAVFSYKKLSRGEEQPPKGKEDSNMALTRKMLLAMGIEADKIDQIIEAHTETTDGLKADLQKAEEGQAQTKDALQNVTKERDDLAKHHEDAKKQFEELQKTSGDAATVKKEFDEYKAAIEGEKTNKVKMDAVLAALKEKGVVKAAAVLAKTVDLSALKVEDGRVSGVDECITPLIEESPWVVEKTETKGVPTVTPPSGGNQKPEDAFASGFDEN